MLWASCLVRHVLSATVCISSGIVRKNTRDTFQFYDPNGMLFRPTDNKAYANIWDVSTAPVVWEYYKNFFGFWEWVGAINMRENTHIYQTRDDNNIHVGRCHWMTPCRAPGN